MLSKKWKKRLGVAGFLAFIAFGGVVAVLGPREWTRRQGEKELAVAVAAASADDPDWRWEARRAKRDASPLKPNSADLLPRVRALLPPGWADSWEAHEKRWPVFEWPPPNTRFSAEERDAARSLLDRAPAALELARTFNDHPDGGWDEEPISPWRVLSPDRVCAEHVAGLLRWGAVLAVERGDTATAVEDALALRNLGRSVGGDAAIVFQLRRMAYRRRATKTAEWVLGQTALSPDSLARLQAAWLQEAEEPVLLFGFRAERASLDELLKELAAGTIAQRWKLPATPEFRPIHELSVSWFRRVEYTRVRANVLDRMTRAVAVAKLPLHEQPAALSALHAPSDNPIAGMAGVFLPPFKRLGVAYPSDVSLMRSAVAAFACERFRLKSGRWPASLDEISTDVLAAVPTDPFDGKPLRFKALADGVVVYSVGDDGEGKSEGGRFRLWNPDQRRLPPRPTER